MVRGAAGDVRAPRGRAMTAIDIAAAVTAAFALVGIAAVDARTMMIEFRLVAVLAAAALLWHLAGSGLAIVGETGYEIAAAAAIGVAVIAVPIAAAEFRGRRWPVGGGDAPLLGGIGLLLGLRGLSWALLAGAACALVHRCCLQRKRGRPFAKGRLPIGPGLCAGALVVFLAMLASGAAHAEAAPPAPSPGTDPAGLIAAVELPPEPFVLPPELAARQVTVSLEDPVPFERLVAELKRVSGLSVLVEERPGRVSGATTDLPDPPLIAWTFEGALQDLLWSVRDRAGYAAELRGGDTLVLYRHLDADWPLPKGAPPAPPPAAEREPAPGLFAAFSESWLGRILGRGRPDRGEAPDAARERPAARSEAPAQSAAPARPPAESSLVAAPAQSEPAAAPVETASPPATASAEAAPSPGPAEPRTADDGAGKAAPPAPPPSPAAWPVRAADHETLQGVLSSWADTAGWTLVWRASRRYALSADAEFRGGFLDAVDQLLADAATRRSLAATAHAPNRHLVIDDVEGAR